MSDGAKRMRLDVLKILLETTPSKVLNPDTLARQLDAAGRADEAAYVRERMRDDDFYRDLVTTCFARVDVLPVHVRALPEPLAWQATLRHLVRTLGAARLLLRNTTLTGAGVDSFEPPLDIDLGSATISCEAYANRAHVAVAVLPVNASTDLQRIGFVLYFNYAPDPYGVELPLERQEPIAFTIDDSLPTLADVEERDAPLRVAALFGVDGARVYSGRGFVAEPFDEAFALDYELVWRASAATRLARLFGANEPPPAIRAYLRLRLSVRPALVSSRVLHAIDLRQRDGRLAARESLTLRFRVDSTDVEPPIRVPDTLPIGSRLGRSLRRLAAEALPPDRRLVDVRVPVEWDARSGEPSRYAAAIATKTMLGELVGPPRASRPSSEGLNERPLVIELTTRSR